MGTAIQTGGVRQRNGGCGHVTLAEGAAQVARAGAERRGVSRGRAVDTSGGERPREQAGRHYK